MAELQLRLIVLASVLLYTSAASSGPDPLLLRSLSQLPAVTAGPSCQRRCQLSARRAVSTAAIRRCSYRRRKTRRRRRKARSCLRRVYRGYRRLASSRCAALCRRASTSSGSTPSASRPGRGRTLRRCLRQCGRRRSSARSRTCWASCRGGCRSGCQFRFPYQVTVSVSPRRRQWRRPQVVGDMAAASAGDRALSDQLGRVEELLKTLISQLGNKTQPVVHVHNAAPNVHVHNSVQAVSRSESAAAARAAGAAAAQRGTQESRVVVTGNGTTRPHTKSNKKRIPKPGT